MSDIDLLLKIGGSILTDKHQPGVVNHQLIAEICQILKTLYDRNLKFVIVTGVGNAGHQSVAKFSVHKGDDGSFNRRIGLLHAQIQVNKLRNIFLQSLFDAGVPAIQFYTSSIAETDRMKPMRFYLHSIQKFLDLGMIPVVSGDVVADQSMGFSVMSGDIAFLEIFKQWKPKLAVFGTDVSGIYTADPQVDKNAELIQIIDANMMQEALQGITEGTVIDVSGAMKGKYKAILSVLNVDNTIVVHVMSLKNPSNLVKLIDNKPFNHTIFQY